MLGWVLLMAAMVGEAASLTLSVERFRLAADPADLLPRRRHGRFG